MTTRSHLIYDLQELYALQRDVVPLLLEMRGECADTRVKQLLHDESESLRNEMETIERALNLLGAHFKHERSPIVPAFKEATERFKRQNNPPAEQRDIHAALELLKEHHLCVAAYLGEVEMARAIGEQDVAKLLEESLQRQQQRETTLRETLPSIITEISRGESRQAA